MTIRTVILLCALVLCYRAVNAQPSVLWNNDYGIGAENRFNSALQTNDGGWLLGGTTGDSSFTSGEAWLVKLNSSGKIQWQKTFGKPAIMDVDAINDILPSNGGFIIAGTIGKFFNAYHGGLDGFVAKIDDTGKFLWAYSYGGSDFDGIAQIIQCHDGGFVFSGTTLSTDIPGFHNSLPLYGEATADMWVGEIDSIGQLIWTFAYGGTSWDYGGAIAELSDHTICVGGSTLSTGGDITKRVGELDRWDGWLVYLDSLGQKIEDKCFGSKGATSIQGLMKTENDNLILGGYLQSDTSNINDTWFTRTTQSGSIIWSNDQTQWGEYQPDFFIPSHDDRFYLTGHIRDFDSNIWIANIDGDGRLLWKLTYLYQDSGKFPFASFSSIADADDGGFLAVGSKHSLKHASRGCVTRYGPPLLNSVKNPAEKTFSCYPSPTSTVLNITLDRPGKVEVVNVLGETVLEVPWNGVNSQIDVSRLSPGLFFVRNHTQQSRFVKQ
jgi:hypothetical protein